jgi:hypothetical protein
MPKTYSVSFTGNRADADAGLPSAPVTRFYSSQTIANKAARDGTTADDGLYMEAVVRQHHADKASLDTILDALNGTGWATPANATIVKQFRNGRAVA